MEQSAVSASLCSVQGLTTEHRHPDRSPGTPRRTVFFHSFSAKKGNTFHMARRQQEQIGDKAAVLVLRVRIRKISYLNLEWIFGKYIVVVADGLFCREIDGLFCRSSPDIIVRRRCVLSHKRRGWLEPSPSFRYSRNLALQDELYHPVINNGPAVLVCVDKRLGTGPVNQSRDAG